MGCKKPSEPFVSFACTDAKGRFSLWITDVSVLPLPVKFEHEHNAMQTQLSLSDLGGEIGTITFEQAHKGKSKIAIVIDIFSPYEPMSHGTGADSLQLNLIEAQFEEQFAEMYELNDDDYDVEFMPMASLFEDKDKNDQLDIFDFNIVYLISRNDEELSGLSKDNKNVLLDFISKGGELFVTTLSVEAEDPSLDEFI
jgi:hypothetical protein